MSNYLKMLKEKDAPPCAEWFDNGGKMVNVCYMNSKQTIGERVLLVRRQLGLTQSEFGTLLGGFKKSAVSAYEKNDNPLSVATAIKIAELAQIPLDELLLGSSDGDVDCEECGSGVVARSELTYFENRVLNMLSDLDPRDYSAVLEFLASLIATSPYRDDNHPIYNRNQK